MLTSLRIVCIVAVYGLAAACATAADDDLAMDTTTESTTTTSEPTTTTTEATTTTTEPTTTTTEPTTTTTEPPTTEPPTTEPPPAGLGDGVHLVGTDVQPGRYISAAGDFCYWERLSGLSGSFEEIITNDTPEGQAIVEVVPEDVAFSSDGCGGWTLYEAPAAPTTEFGPGDWVVDEQIEPGTYQAEGELCYWERATAFLHDFDEIITNDVPTGRAVVEIAPGDVRFTSNGCGTWTPL